MIRTVSKLAQSMNISFPFSLSTLTLDTSSPAISSSTHQLCCSLESDCYTSRQVEKLRLLCSRLLLIKRRMPTGTSIIHHSWPKNFNSATELFRAVCHYCHFSVNREAKPRTMIKETALVVGKWSKVLLRTQHTGEGGGFLKFPASRKNTPFKTSDKNKHKNAWVEQERICSSPHEERYREKEVLRVGQGDRVRRACSRTWFGPSPQPQTWWNTQSKRQSGKRKERRQRRTLQVSLMSSLFCLFGALSLGLEVGAGCELYKHWRNILKRLVAQR